VPHHRLLTSVAELTKEEQPISPRKRRMAELLSPHILHFLVRPGPTEQTPTGPCATTGPLVPLIPVDLLPEWLEIKGVPRSLELGQTENMTNLGAFHRPANPIFAIRIVSESEAPADPAPVRVASTSISSVHDQPQQPQQQPQQHLDVSPAGEHSRPPSAQGSTGSLTSVPSSSSDNNETASLASLGLLNLPYPTPYPGGGRGGPLSSKGKHTKGGKNAMKNGGYCKYWCRTGKCDYGRGCIYKHHMPENLEGLHKVGLREYPPWWLYIQGVVSPYPNLSPVAMNMHPVQYVWSSQPQTSRQARTLHMSMPPRASRKANGSKSKAKVSATKMLLQTTATSAAADFNSHSFRDIDTQSEIGVPIPIPGVVARHVNEAEATVVSKPMEGPLLDL
jgi:hypothetical protein